MCYHYEDYDCNRCMGLEEEDYDNEPCSICERRECICDELTDAAMEDLL